MSYKIKSLGYRTDFIFNRLDGTVEDKGDYIVAKTKSNPHFFWGNLLLYKRPPQIGDLDIWKKQFQKEFIDLDTYHITLAWDSVDGEEGECSEFINDGFELDKAVVLTTNEVSRPRKFNNDVVVKEIIDKENFDECVIIQTQCADDHLSQKAWKDFYTVSMKNYRKLITKGHGKWFGAYLDGKLVGSLGLFTENEVGRFQIVSTHPGFQRLGVCSTLVYECAKIALNVMGVKSLVMVADEEYHAARIYESIGFKPNQRQIGLCWWDKKRHC